jgi:hypothetical protein
MTRPLLSSGEEKPINCITNEGLLAWLDEYIRPAQWFIKITGGEPGLYPEIDALIPALADRGYSGYIETNGSLPIPKHDNFPRLAAWHKDRPMPEYYDAVYIIEDPEDDWEEKARHCEDNNIPYYKTMMRGKHSPVPLEERVAADEAREPSMFGELMMMYSQGELMPCPAYHKCYGDIWEMAEPLTQPLRNEHCTRCPQTFMADLFCKAGQDN